MLRTRNTLVFSKDIQTYKSDKNLTLEYFASNFNIDHAKASIFLLHLVVPSTTK